MMESRRSRTILRTLTATVFLGGIWQVSVSAAATMAEKAMEAGCVKKPIWLAGDTYRCETESGAFSYFNVVGGSNQPSGQSGKTLTAICPEPTGRATGWRGKLQKGQAFDGPDGFKGGHVTIIWEIGSQQARILTKAASDPPTLSEKAVRIFQSEDQISFLVPYPPIGVYMYSLFPGPRKILIAGHTGALLDENGATSKTFSGQCEITIK